MAAAKKKPAPKRGASRYQAPAKKPVPGWVWMVCGLVIGGFFVFLFNLEPGRDEVKRAKPEEQQRAATQQPKPQLAPEPTKPKYDFYTLLPESEVIVPPAALPPADAATPPGQPPVSPEEAAKLDAARAEALLNGQTPPAAPTPAETTAAPAAAKAPTSTQFFLQAGAFRKREDADKVRAQILMLGQSVQVEPGKVRDENWFRVLVGPYASREELAGAQKQLASSGFSNLLLQQR